MTVRILGATALPLLIALALSLLPSCTPSAQSLKDTEGRSFSYQCSSDKICSMTQQSGPGMAQSNPPKSGQKDPAGALVQAPQTLTLRASGRVIGICGPIAAGTQPAPSECRPLACNSDSDCPTPEGVVQPKCSNHVCTEPTHAITTDDSVMLCMAGTGVGPRDAAQVERLALGLNCGNPCRVPRICRQP